MTTFHPSLQASISHQSLLSDDWTKVFANGKHADVAFFVQEEKIVAHKCLLAARCLYFESMFDSDLKEGASNEINVPDVRPEIFRVMLEYLYSGQLPKPSWQDAVDTVAAADKYGVDLLTKHCESILCSQLSKENVIEALHVADGYNCPELMLQATSVLKMYGGERKEEDGWKRLKTNPELLLKLFASCFND